MQGEEPHIQSFEEKICFTRNRSQHRSSSHKTMSYFSSIPFTIHTQLWSYLTYTTSSSTYTNPLLPYTPLFPQFGLHNLRSYNFFPYNLHPYNLHLYNLHLYNLLFPRSSLHVLSIPLYLQSNGRRSMISIYIWMQLKWRRVLSVMPGGLICA